MKKLLTIFIVMLSISANAQDYVFSPEALSLKVTTLENRVNKIEKAIGSQTSFENLRIVSLKELRNFLGDRAINLWATKVSNEKVIPKFYNVIKACFEKFEAENPQYPDATYSIENVNISDKKDKNAYGDAIEGNAKHLKLYTGASAQGCYNWLNAIVLNNKDL